MRSGLFAGVVWAAVVAGLATGLATGMASGGAAVQAAEHGGRTPTLKQIMSDPEWVARSPSGAYWSWDGSAVVYSRRIEGSRLSERWRVDVGLDEGAGWDVGEAGVIADEDLPYVTASGGVFDAARSRKIFSRSGDVFVRDMRTGELSQVTRTTARETSPMFMADRSVAFVRGGDWIVRDAATGMEWEVADIRAEDEPEEKTEEEMAEERDHLEAQQHRLFAIVRDRAAREEEREDRRDRLREADGTRVAGPFYLGEDWRVHRRTLSAAGRWMVLVVSKEKDSVGGDGTRDEMPAYVNEDGYVSSSSVRPKVGIEKERDEKLVVLDLEDEAVHWLKVDGLPMISDDPLAWLKAKEEEGLNAEDAEGSEEDGEAEARPEEEEKEVKPRAVSVERVAWSGDGERVAVQLRSRDNKDRWIAVVDFDGSWDGEPALEPVHHQRDEAWINWRYNEMGWTRDSQTLWYLSEESGYGHLYAWDAGTGETRRLTGADGDGRFTVQDVQESPAGGVLYYRSNRSHPGVYELERVAVGTGRHEALTSLGGTVEGYDVSPDGGRVIMRWSTAMDPPELFVMETNAGADAERVTFTDSELYRSFDWVEPRFVEVASSFVDDPIHCRVYDDPVVAASSDRGKPVVLFSHGAGYTQHVYDGWSYYFREHMFHTLLCRMGYVVIAPDFRASAGYGRDWRTAIYRKMGYPELEDFDDSLAWLDANYAVDLENVGIYGGSYGGFMTLMAMFLRPDVYEAGAALRSVTDWSHYNHGYTSNILNTPEVDPEAFARSSPIEHAEGLEGALLMCHGMLDDNVVAQDTIRLAQRLIELEKEDWEMALYPVEPHGFLEPTGWLDEYRRILKLFETHLKD